MTRCCCGRMSIPDGQLTVTDTDTVHRAGGPCYVDEGTECGTMSDDPAVDAAQRAMPMFSSAAPHRSMIDAAREALAPIRALIEDARSWTPYDTHDIGDAVLHSSFENLLDELSELVYRKDELT